MFRLFDGCHHFGVTTIQPSTSLSIVRREEEEVANEKKNERHFRTNQDANENNILLGEPIKFNSFMNKEKNHLRISSLLTRNCFVMNEEVSLISYVKFPKIRNDANKQKHVSTTSVDR